VTLKSREIQNPGINTFFSEIFVPGTTKRIDTS
jgi:hypothetical protein